jgi:hypothetical protein
VPVRINQPGSLQVGQFFENCSFHPCVCSSVDEAGVQVEGVSLVNGGIGCCNVQHCGLRLLRPDEAVQWRISGPPDVELSQGKWW